MKKDIKNEQVKRNKPLIEIPKKRFLQNQSQRLSRPLKSF